jgi:hypothetical protein
MNKRFGFSRRSKLLAVAISTTLLLMAVGIAFALVITIDGDRSPANEWGVNPETCSIGTTGCSRFVSDNGGVPDITSPNVPAYDIDNVHASNDGTNLYFSLDFFANGSGTENTWYLTSSGRPMLTICLDIDNNVATGGSRLSGNCNGTEAMSGVDYYVEIVSSAGLIPDGIALGYPKRPVVYAWNSGTSTFDAMALGNIGYDQDADAITEIGVALTDLGYVAGSHLCPGTPLSGTGQPCTARVAMYYDNGTGPSDDSIPNTGTANFQFGCDIVGSNGCSPTAVTLNSLEAKTDAQNNTAVVILAASVVATLGLAGVVVARRRRTA